MRKILAIVLSLGMLFVTHYECYGKNVVGKTFNYTYSDGSVSGCSKRQSESSSAAQSYNSSTYGSGTSVTSVHTWYNYTLVNGSFIGLQSETKYSLGQWGSTATHTQRCFPTNVTHGSLLEISIEANHSITISHTTINVDTVSPY